uniref:Uncharacterized protein n=1 Tax=Rhizophora mucronata TaxID=61149 RepID=A0A2P2P6X6_RHIMU
MLGKDTTVHAFDSPFYTAFYVLAYIM